MPILKLYSIKALHKWHVNVVNLKKEKNNYGLKNLKTPSLIEVIILMDTVEIASVEKRRERKNQALNFFFLLQTCTQVSQNLFLFCIHTLSHMCINMGGVYVGVGV